MAYKKITDPPTNVKEAIDWLIRIGRKDNTYNDKRNILDAFCDSVNKLLGNGAKIEKDKLKGLFEALGTFIGWENGEIGDNGIAKNYLKELGLQSDGNVSAATSSSTAVTSASPSPPAAGVSTSQDQNSEKAAALLQQLLQQLEKINKLADNENTLPNSIVCILSMIDDEKNTNSSGDSDNSSDSDNNPLTQLMDVAKAIGPCHPVLKTVLEKLKANNQATSLSGMAEDINSCIKGLDDALKTIGKLNAQDVSKTAKEWLDKVKKITKDKKTLSKIAEHLNSDSTSEEKMKQQLSNGDLKKEVDDFTTWLSALVSLSGGGLAEMVEALKTLLETMKGDTQGNNGASQANLSVVLNKPDIIEKLSEANEATKLAVQGYKSAYGSKSIHTLWVPCIMRKQASQSCCTPPCKDCGTDPYKECPPEGCCQNCPKAICARIFLGQIPKLYHSFKFMLWISNTKWTSDGYNSKITAYLVSMGFNIGNIQNGSTNTGANQLHTTFKSALQGFKQNASTPPSPSTPSYEPKGLKEIHDKLESYLKGLLQAQHTNALQSIANGGTDTRRRPRTIRDMLHWLSGVPFSVVYSEMQQFSNSLCDLTLAMTRDKNGEQKMKHTIHPEWISYRLGVSCAECLDVLQAIEDPLGKEPQKRFEAYIKASDFYYPANPSQLFYMFVDIIYNVYVQMKFVCNMTGRPKEEGGWERCNFWAGKPLKGIENVSEDKIVCKCLPSGSPFTCQLACRRFLDGSNDSFFRPKYPLSFNIKNITSAPLQARAIHNVIKHIFGSSNNYSVLCRLLLAVSICPPTSIGDMISFLYWYRQKMFPGDTTQPGATNAADAEKYRNALHQEIDMFPGTFKPSILTNALGALMSEHGAGGGRTTSGNKTHTHNMLSILDCYGTAEDRTSSAGPSASQQAQSLCTSASCAPYLRPLAYDIYKIYVPQFSRAYLSWILHFGPRVYTALEELKGKLNVDCEHCKQDTNSIVTCNAVLPELHSKGLDFYDPKVLNGWKYNKENKQYTAQNGTKKTCTLFATQLGAVLRTCNPGDPSAAAPLHKLIEAIEQFLWSIRMPFSLVQLSLWSVAILFISYVFVVPLDHFKIKSHLFNRLKYTMHPSLLIADQQRRVSEVAYFSL